MEQTMTLREQEIWAAGFFDGEGCIMISIHKPRGNCQLCVRASQIMKEPLEKMQELFGGTIYRHKQDAYQWQVATQMAANMLKRVQPWLIVKRSQCDLALEFQSRRHERFQHTTSAEKEQDFQDYQKMRQLKKVRDFS
jgi:hypothetical protein